MRNTLELFVKKDRIERSHRQRAVMYTAHPGQDTAYAADDTTGETADAETVKTNKVSVQV
ncbi:hypothetical protein ABZX74_46275 [Streptomyces olivaceoviridis]|uniref:hypothetical protein n=1 Tax=Streptomyces olivaceoviridis TaxID=1921 RepID=UPI0033BE2E4C